MIDWAGLQAFCSDLKASVEAVAGASDVTEARQRIPEGKELICKKLLINAVPLK